MRGFGVVLALGAVSLGACVPAKSLPPDVPVNSTAAVARHPFGSHPQPYAAGAIFPSGERADLDRATASFYDVWKSKHLVAACGAGRWVVASRNRTRQLTVSEAIGYGMIIMPLMAGYDPRAKEYFDGLYQFFRDHRSDASGDLMAWQQSLGCNSVEGNNSATDGSLDIAYGLLLASKQWGDAGAIDYGAEARAVIKAIGQLELHRSGEYLLLGDWVKRVSPSHLGGTRSSDYMLGHFATFAAVTGDATWTRLGDASYRTIGAFQRAHSPETGLLADFILQPDAPVPAPAVKGFLEGPHDGQYWFNACRNPLRLGLAYLHTGDARARDVVRPTNAWIRRATGGEPARIHDGYWLDGTPVPASEERRPDHTAGRYTMAFIAPFGVAAMVDAANQAWLDAHWKLAVTKPAEAYYPDTLRLLSMLVMSGNWWAPERL